MLIRHACNVCRKAEIDMLNRKGMTTSANEETEEKLTEQCDKEMT
jgi:hypothetical protein